MPESDGSGTKSFPHNHRITYKVLARLMVTEQRDFIKIDDFKFLRFNCVYRIFYFKDRGVYLILGLLDAAFIRGRHLFQKSK